jgi:hypothetical protein
MKQILRMMNGFQVETSPAHDKLQKIRFELYFRLTTQLLAWPYMALVIVVHRSLWCRCMSIHRRSTSVAFVNEGCLQCHRQT